MPSERCRGRFADVADPEGGVSVPLDTDPAVAQEICRVATNYYMARRAKPSTTPRAKSTARASTKKTAKREQKAAKATTPPPPAATKRGRGPKITPSSGIDAPPGASPEAKKGPAAKAASKATSKASASKQTKATKVEGKGKAASKKTAAKATTPKEPAARGRKGGKASAEKQAATPTPPAKEEKVSKKPGKTAKIAKDASCGCVTWAAVENKIRGTAKHGTFVVEPEGKRHALYFYDADGQSRHLESGEPGKLRKVAEEMAARGQPVLRAPASGVDDAALMRAFLGDDA